jgi:dihydroorotate dehydrogenase (NAD+) catalytic subunit
MIGTYDIGKTYQENYDGGPQFLRRPGRVPETPEKRFLGLPVRSRVGIAAGLLLNSKWLLGYAERGFDILTYKTVRSSYRACYGLPNWVFVEETGLGEGPVYVLETLPEDLTKVSSAVCFGMPSMAPEIWREDVARAKAGLNEGQILIVSVVATPSEHPTVEEVGDDFAQCAEWAAAAGADVIEANFSCPNVCSAEGTIYRDAKLSRMIAEGIRERIGNKPLLLKVGQFESEERLREFMVSVNGKAQGLAMVNGMVRPVLYRDGRPVFGRDFVKAGVLGRAIHGESVEMVRQAERWVRAEGLDLEIAAVGGVSRLSDMADFFDAGAGAVLMGSAPMYLPDLAIEMKRVHPDW